MRHHCPHVHGQNGWAERKDKHVVELGLTFMAQVKLPLSFWWDSFQTDVYIINIFPTPVLNGQSPFQVLFNKSPDYKFLKVFGCAVFPHLHPYNAHKLEFRSKKCLFLGYSTSHKGYKCLSQSGHVYITRNAIFHEEVFPYNELFGSESCPHVDVSLEIVPWSQFSLCPHHSSDDTGVNSSPSAPLDLSDPAISADSHLTPVNSERASTPQHTLSQSSTPINLSLLTLCLNHLTICHHKTPTRCCKK